MLANAEKIINEVKIGGNLGCSDYALDEFLISKNMDLAKRRQDPELQESKLLAV